MSTSKTKCVFCHEKGHAVENCENPIIVETMTDIILKLNTELLQFQHQLLDEYTLLENHLTFRKERVEKTIENKLQKILQKQKYTKIELYYILYKHNAHYCEDIDTEHPILSLKLKKNELQNVFVQKYTQFVLDSLYFHYGKITGTIKTNLAKKIIEMLKKFEHTENIHSNVFRLYQKLMTLSVNIVRLTYSQILEIMNFIESDIQYHFKFIYLPENIKHVYYIVKDQIKQIIKRKSLKVKIQCKLNYDMCHNSEYCAICLEDSQSNLKLNCDHIFCSNCIVNVVEHNLKNNKRSNCPLCRSDIEDIETNDFAAYNKLSYITA